MTDLEHFIMHVSQIQLHMNKAYSIEITQTRYRYNGRKMNFISDSFENSFWNKIFRFLEAIYKIRLFSIIISSYVVHTLAFTDGFLIRMAFIRMDLVILRAISNRTICEMWEESVQFGSERHRCYGCPDNFQSCLWCHSAESSLQNYLKKKRIVKN